MGGIEDWKSAWAFDTDGIRGKRCKLFWSDFLINCICSGIRFLLDAGRVKTLSIARPATAVVRKRVSGMAELVLYGSWGALFQLHFSNDAT